MSMQITIFEHSKTEKRCCKCKEIKPFNYFSKSKGGKYGIDSECKQCKSIYHQNNKEAQALRMKVYYENNKKHLALAMKVYRENNKEELREKAKVFYKKNKEAYALRNKVYIENNKEAKRQYDKVYYQNNKKALLQRNLVYENQRRKSDPLFRLIHNLRRRIYRFCKSVGLKKNWKTIDAMGCTREEFIAYFQNLFTEGMTWENYGAWHVDHIKPISLATTEQEAIELNHYTNLQPLWAADNIRKSNKYD
jgi:predicted DNA-binding protein (UPF0251 family)